MILSAAVDLGSSRFKAAVLDEAGTLHDMKRSIVRGPVP